MGTIFSLIDIMKCKKIKKNEYKSFDFDTDLNNISKNLNNTISEDQNSIIDIMPEDIYKYLLSIENDLLNMHKIWKSKPNDFFFHEEKIKNIPYCAKYGIESYYNTLRLKKVIIKYNLYLLKIPKIYIYTFKNIDDDNKRTITDDNSIVIFQDMDVDVYVPGITFGTAALLNLNQIKQLCTFVVKGQYYHMHAGNYVLDKNGIIYIVNPRYHVYVQKEKAIELRHNYIKNGNHIHTNGNICMNPVINDPLTVLELRLYSARRINFLIDNIADRWFREYIYERERERIKIKLLLEKNIKTNTFSIYDFLEFDHDLYE